MNDITFEINGIPILDRYGEPRKANHMPPVLLPVCDRKTGNDCNGRLERLFEAKGKGVVRTVLQGRPLTSAPEVDAFTRWWLKTLLLLCHPEARDDFKGAQRRPWSMPPSTYPNLINGTFPDDLSLWIAVCDDSGGSAHLPEAMRVLLPRTSRPDGEGGSPESGIVGLGLAPDRLAELLLLLVFHPLCDVKNPFEEAGMAVRLWPHPPPALDLSGLPGLDATGRAQFGALFADGGYHDNLPAAGWRLHLEAVLDGHPIPPPVLVATRTPEVR